jgi:3-oxoacyl-[acyl-carrier-protein] synthase
MLKIPIKNVDYSLTRSPVNVIAGIKVPRVLNEETIEVSGKRRGELRRLNSISRTFLESVNKLLNDLSFTDGDNTGLIVNTVYGPLKTNMQFGDTLLKDGLKFSSPSVFANTVSNSVLGHVAKFFNLKGYSTLLMGSNAIVYAIRLLKKCDGKDNLVVGGVDEVLDQVRAYSTAHFGKDIFNEAVGSVFLGFEDTMPDLAYITGYSESSLGYAPLYSDSASIDVQKKFSQVIQKALKMSESKAGDITKVYLASDSYLGLREAELSAIQALFSEYTQMVALKDMVGETLAASSFISLAVATSNLQGPDDKVVVLNLEASGSLSALVVSK